MEFPKILNIGSGKDFKEDCLNLDKDERWRPDIIKDLNLPILERGKYDYHTKRFGNIRLEKEVFKKIIAKDVLEHIQNLTICMKSCRDLLEEKGIMEILVPYDLSLGAWQDPTHVRAFNENSWKYYNEWAWYLGWKREILEVEKIEYEISKKYKSLNQRVRMIELIRHIPRAVDAMKVRLKKITIKERR